MSTPSVLIGREQASSMLAAAMSEAGAGRGALLLVKGDAGVGKTALVARAADQAATVLGRQGWGRAFDGLGSPAYWPWTQVLRQLDVLSDREHLGEGAAGEDRFRLFERVAAALDEASRPEGLLVVLDDLHWADADSLALLELVGRSLVDRRILVLGTYRDTEADEGLAQLARSAEVLPLDGLSISAVAELLHQLTGTEPSADEATRMSRRTGGNPFFVRELTRLSQLRSDRGQGGAATDVVDSVRDVIERRLARLSQPAVQLLSAAAMDRATLRPWLLGRLFGGSLDVSALVDEATTQRVLNEESGSVAFSHDLFREVIVSGLSAVSRRELHRAIGAALESGRSEGMTVHAAELAAHFSEATGTGDLASAAVAVRYGREAAEDSARRLAFDEATAQLERSLAALDRTGPTPDLRLGLLLDLAAAQQAAGRLAVAAATFREAFDLARNVSDAAGQARAALGLHGTGVKTGPSAERDAQASVLVEALAAAEREAPELVPAARAALARTLYHSLESGRMARARSLATLNLDAARDSPDPAALVAALWALHDVTWAPGTARERLTLLDELVGLVGAEDRQLGTLQAQALLELGDPGGRTLIEHVSSQAALTGRPGDLWFASSRRAASALAAGRLEDAAAHVDEAEKLVARLDDDDARWITDLQRWELARFTGGRGDYRRRRPGTEPQVERWPPWRSLQLAEAGRPDEAVAALDGFTATEAHGPGVNAGYDLWFPAIAAEAAARSGQDRLRTDLFELLAPYAGTQVGCGAWVAYCGPVDGYLAALAFSLGDSALGAAHLASAEEQCDRLDAPRWLAWVRAASARHAAADRRGNVLARQGQVWQVTFDGVAAVVPDSKGLRDVAVLVERPHHSVSAAELAGAGPPDRGEPVLDRRAVAAYRSRLQELDEEIDDAAADHDLGRTARARGERDALLEELARSTGHLGRSRRLGDDSERVRKTVRARIHRALVQLATQHPALAEHLEASIETGGWCTYRPAEPMTWTVTS